MTVYRVVISFMRQLVHFQQERGVLAMTPGQALDDVMTALKVDRTQINSLKIWVEDPIALDIFHTDTQSMIAINSSMSVRDLWNRKHAC